MAQTGFLIGISSASSSLHTTRNQNLRFQMLTFHFPIEEMGGGNHFSSLSHSSSPGICQKEILSPANFCPCCRTDTKSREAAKPGSAAIPRHPMAQDQLEEGGRVSRRLPCPTFVTCFLHKVLWDVWCQPYIHMVSPASLLRQHQACAGPPMSPTPQPVPTLSLGMGWPPTG